MPISRLVHSITNKIKLPTKSLKKNLTNAVKNNPDAELLFCDEARFGTHSNLGHGWFKKGSRTQIKVKLGYQNFYLYGAANPLSGKNFSLLLPKVNTQCMQLFLSELAKNFNNKKVILVMDGAGWHHSKELKIPTNFTLLYLPPYSPELNPIERLWLYIKHHIVRNTIYDSIEALENAVCNFVNTLTYKIIKSTCKSDYLFN